MKIKAKGVKKPEVKRIFASNNESEILSLQETLKAKETEILTLEQECISLRREILSLQIFPFKLGDEAIAEVPVGKTRKKCKCVLEDNGGILYVRPYKKDGELSSRNFCIFPISPHTYGDFLEKV